MSINDMKLVVIFHRFGPYHDARLKNLAKYCNLHAVECSSKDDTYRWDSVSNTTEYKWYTLENEVDIDHLPKNVVVQLIENCLSKIKPDVVAIPGWSSTYSLIAMKWCVDRRVPVVMMSDSTEYDSRRTYIKELIKSSLVNNANSAFVAGSDHEDYIFKLGMKRENIFQGYDVVDNNYFRSEANLVKSDSDNKRREFGLPYKYFLASSRFIEKKNIPTLIDAYGKYLNITTSEQWSLVILGDGELNHSINKYICSLGLESLIHMKGFQQYDVLPTFYALASVFVHSSKSEQWGLVVNEAMATGLPVIVSNSCGCSNELVVEGGNGYLFNPNNSDELAKKLLKISCLEEEKLKKMGSYSQNIVSNWDLDRFSTGILGAAQKALDTQTKKTYIFDKSILNLMIKIQ